MRRRILIGVSIFLSVGLILFGAGWLMQPKPRIDQETFAQIKEGMTRREVEGIIGAPPGDYGVGKGDLQVIWDTGLILWHEIDDRDWNTAFPVRTNWLGQQNAISVWFDENGKATRMNFPPVYREYDSSFDRLLGSIGLKEKKQQGTVYIY